MYTNIHVTYELDKELNRNEYIEHVIHLLFPHCTESISSLQEELIFLHIQV